MRGAGRHGGSGAAVGDGGAAREGRRPGDHFFHAAEYLWAAARARHHDDEAAKRWAEKLCGLLKAGRLGDVLAALRAPGCRLGRSYSFPAGYFDELDATPRQPPWQPCRVQLPPTGLQRNQGLFFCGRGERCEVSRDR